jgi:hypothetical protein
VERTLLSAAFDFAFLTAAQEQNGRQEQPWKSGASAPRNHARKEAVLALDIRNFFPNIRPERVTKVFERLGYPGEAAKILTRLTTYKHQLPQGPPTSPAIANLCIPRIDATERPRENTELRAYSPHGRHDAVGLP